MLLELHSYVFKDRLNVRRLVRMKLSEFLKPVGERQQLLMRFFVVQIRPFELVGEA